MPAREQIERIYREAVLAVDPRACVRDALALDEAGRALHAGPETVEIPEDGISLIAIGKAGPAMAAGALDALGDRVRGGIVVTKAQGEVDHDGVEVLLGSHPVPDPRSLDAGRAVLDVARGVANDGLVLCLISGGGSALVEALREGVSLEDLQDLTRQLLRAGATINELNAVRSRLSLLKGGGLLRELGRARVVNLIISDVLGDDLQTIASGPTVPPAEGLSAAEVLRRYGIAATLPEFDGNAHGVPVATRIVGNLDMAIDAAALAAQSLGLNPVVLTNGVEGEARDIGELMASMLLNHARPYAALPPGSCLIAGGETTVTVRGEGQGGRNTEAALAAALRLSGSAGLTLAFLATDGDDGTTGAAGAIVDGATIKQMDGGRARAALVDNDSYRFLAGTGAVWAPGATGTNVNDLIIGIVE